MSKVCEKCGREYRFPVCEFCARENVWNHRSMKTHMEKYFTPRMIRDFGEYSSVRMNAYVNQIADTFEESEGMGIYIWENRPRTGKTMFAMFLFAELLKRAYINGTSRDFMFTSMMDLLDADKKYQSIYPSARGTMLPPIDTAAHVSLLVLDDFGTEKRNTCSCQL